ncbi:hypothetical protein HML84_16365 [Alcanivorax sp. IO_7]|nr:hypothetical protein HML84_16365 [Alcanivorax sp. IO_7]
MRLHPRGGGAPWRDLARTDPALDLRPGDESLEQALDGCQAVWCGYTTAIIDCAVARVPVVVLDRSRDYFQCDRHGVPRVATVRELELAMDEVVETPALCSHRMAAFARYHIEHADDPVSSLADRIGALVAGHEPRTASGFRRRTCTRIMRRLFFIAVANHQQRYFRNLLAHTGLPGQVLTWRGLLRHWRPFVRSGLSAGEHRIWAEEKSPSAAARGNPCRPGTAGACTWNSAWRRRPSPGWPGPTMANS